MSESEGVYEPAPKTDYDETSSSNISILKGNNEFDNQRRQWTRGHKKYNPHLKEEYNPSHPVLSDVLKYKRQDIYNMLISSQPLSAPIPLDFITTILVNRKM